MMVRLSDASPGPGPVSEPVPERSRWMPSFDFEKLDVYQKAIEFVALSQEVVELLPKGAHSHGPSLFGVGPGNGNGPGAKSRNMRVSPNAIGTGTGRNAGTTEPFQFSPAEPVD